MKSILDKSFVYVPAHETDIRKTFERVRREQAKADEQRAAERAKAYELAKASNVKPITQSTKVKA